MRAGIDARGEEADGLQPARIGGVENRHPIAEHVADINMAAVDHDLYTIRPAALIAVRQVPDPAPDALRRNGRVGSGARSRRQARQGRQTQQPAHVFAASHGSHLASYHRGAQYLKVTPALARQKSSFPPVKTKSVTSCSV